MTINDDKPKTWKAWGGFVNGGLSIWEIDDGYGMRPSPAIFTTRREARQRFQDVRPVTITLAKPRRKKK